MRDGEDSNTGATRDSNLTRLGNHLIDIINKEDLTISETVQVFSMLGYNIAISADENLKTKTPQEVFIEYGSNPTIEKILFLYSLSLYKIVKGESSHEQ